MATNLYETLGLDRNATPEQIRKAYKKRALETHPDRFSAKTDAEKATAEVEFRSVNNAYEVLNDPQNRRTYDRHGVWPPPDTFDTPPPRRSGRREDPFFDFSTNFHGSGMRGFGAGGSSVPPNNPFTDPFVLFNSMFGDLNRHIFEPFTPFSHGDMFGPGGPGPMPAHFDPMDMFGGMGASSGVPQRFRSESSFRASGGRYGLQRESRSTTTINGVTQSTWTRVDSNGNEHITHTYPDGREVYTINGIEQAPQRDNGERFLPPPPGNMHGAGYPPPPLINGPAPPRYHSHEHDGPYNSAAVYPDRHWDPAREHDYDSERVSKRRWWQGRR